MVARWDGLHEALDGERHSRERDQTDITNHFCGNRGAGRLSAAVLFVLVLRAAFRRVARMLDQVNQQSPERAFLIWTLGRDAVRTSGELLVDYAVRPIGDLLLFGPRDDRARSSCPAAVSGRPGRAPAGRAPRRAVGPQSRPLSLGAGRRRGGTARADWGDLRSIRALLDDRSLGREELRPRLTRIDSPYHVSRASRQPGVASFPAAIVTIEDSSRVIP